MHRKMPNVQASVSKQSVTKYSRDQFRNLDPIVVSNINLCLADIHRGWPDALLIQYNLVATVAGVWTFLHFWWNESELIYIDFLIEVFQILKWTRIYVNHPKPEGPPIRVTLINTTHLVNTV